MAGRFADDARTSHFIIRTTQIRTHRRVPVNPTVMSLPQRLDIRDIPACARYLVITARRSERGWKQECAAVRNWLATSPEALSQDDVDAMLRTINSTLPSDAHPVAVSHCYADVPAGTQYDIVFDRNDPNTNESASAEVLFGVAFDKYVDRKLSHGHHQTAVLRFPNGMPSLLGGLPWDAISSDYLCLCAAADFADIRRCLIGTLSEQLNSFLADPAYPRWSSYALERMFADIDGNPSQQLLTILPPIDERLVTRSQKLTEEQAHFLRAVTLHVYPANLVTTDDISWLIFRFRSEPTPQRALIIALLIPLHELPCAIRSKILLLLQETPGDRYVAGERADDLRAT